MFLSDFGSREVFGEAFQSREGCWVLHDGGAGGRCVFGVVYGRSCRGDPWGRVLCSGRGTLWPVHFAIVMLGTPT